MARKKTSEKEKRSKARLRKQRQRQRENSERGNRPLSADALHDIIIQEKFSEFIAERGSDLEDYLQGLHAGGILFTGNLALEDHSGVYPEDSMWVADFQVPLNSLNRSIVMIGGMIAAATELARLVNQYKMQETNRAIAEAESGNASMIEIEKLYRVRNRLLRTVKVSLPVYFVDGS